MKVRKLHPRLAITVDRSETLTGAAKHLADDDIGTLLIFGAAGLEGIFSERDLVRAVSDGAELEVEQVGSYMTEAPIRIDLTSDLEDAFATMNEYSVRHLVVTDGEDIVGVISSRDMLALFGPAPG